MDCKHHSTETALLYIHDHLINAIRSQKLSCLCLLDLSASFNTIDHNILITRISSWFGIHGFVLNWFKSYLTSYSFHVKCDKDFSSEHISSCGVLQGSVLGPVLFVMYTTPLSTVISSLSLNHHFCADDSQLFFSFHTRNKYRPPPNCFATDFLLDIHKSSYSYFITLLRLNFLLLVSKGNFL